MTHPNPFAQNVPANEQPAQQQPAPNPFAQQQAAPAAQSPAAPNPFVQQQAPQQQYAAPQAYAPAAAPPPAYGPYGQPAQQAPQQQYAPAPAPAPQQQYAAPAALGQATAPPPPPPSGGKGATVPDMYGRLVLIFPHIVQTVPRRPQHITDEQRARGDVNQERMTATVVVLDDGQGGMQPIAFGGNPHVLGGRPHDQSAPLPYVRKGMWINQSKVIAQLTDYLPGRSMAGPSGAPGAAVGRLVKEGPEQNAAWYLTTPNEQELGLANTYLGLVAQGQYPHPLSQ